MRARLAKSRPWIWSRVQKEGLGEEMGAELEFFSEIDVRSGGEIWLELPRGEIELWCLR